MRKKLSFYLVIPQERESHLMSCSIRHHQDDVKMMILSISTMLLKFHPTDTLNVIMLLLMAFFDGGRAAAYRIVNSMLAHPHEKRKVPFFPDIPLLFLMYFILFFTHTGSSATDLDHPKSQRSAWQEGRKLGFSSSYQSSLLCLRSHIPKNATSS
jgi:hypothetical protein